MQEPLACDSPLAETQGHTAGAFPSVYLTLRMIYRIPCVTSRKVKLFYATWASRPFQRKICYPYLQHLIHLLLQVGSESRFGKSKTNLSSLLTGILPQDTQPEDTLYICWSYLPLFFGYAVLTSSQSS